MLRICIRSPIEAVKVNYLIAALSISGLNNHVVHNEVAFDIRSLIFLHFGLRHLSESSLFSSILKQNLHFVHLEFCRSDLDWVRLTFVVSCCLFFCCTVGLPRRLLLSIKLFSKLGSCLVNLGTYRLVLLLFIGLIDKDYSVTQGVGLQIVLTWIQADNGGKDFLGLICITIDQRVDSKLFSALMLVFGIKISILVFLSIYRVKLRLAECCIIWVLHWIIKIPLIDFLCIELLKSILV